MQQARCIRRLNPMRLRNKYRCFSVAAKPVNHSTPMSFRLLKQMNVDYDLENYRVLPKTKETELNRTNSASNLSFAKDKAFLKILTSINLESKDKESILISRLIAYNILNIIKSESNFEKETFAGIAQSLNCILEYFDEVGERATEKELQNKAFTVYSKGKFDVAKLLNFLISEPDDKFLLFTKEVTTRPAEGKVNLHSGFSIDVGHKSHTFINDNINYRVDMHHPIICICDNLTMEDANKVIELSLMKRSDVLFISNKVDAQIERFLISRNSETQNCISLLKISDSKSSSDFWVNFLDKKLKDLGEVSENFKPKLKTVDRVIMDDSSSTFIDSSFDCNKDCKEDSKFKQIVDVHLRSSNEAWINKYKNEVTEAYIELKDSKLDILADIDSSLYLASRELEKCKTELSSHRKGFEIVMKAIQVSVNSPYINQNYSSEISYNDILKICKTEGTFISKTKARKVIFDTVAICNYMLRTM